jgi:hypothetical protein
MHASGPRNAANKRFIERKRPYTELTPLLGLGQSVAEYANDGTVVGHLRHTTFMEAINYLIENADDATIEAVVKLITMMAQNSVKSLITPKP